MVFIYNSNTFGQLTQLNIMNQETYTTDRLSLRLTSLSDAEFILKLMNTEPWIKNIGDREVYTVERAKEYINEKMLVQSRKLGFGNYTISKNDTNEKIGTCGLYDREGLDGVDIGFALLPEYVNQGYAYEASSKLLELAFLKFGLQKVNGITTKDNHSSRRLLQKLQLKEMGIVELKDTLDEFLLYQLNRIDFSPK